MSLVYWALMKLSYSFFWCCCGGWLVVILCGIQWRRSVEAEPHLVSKWIFSFFVLRIFYQKHLTHSDKHSQLIYVIVWFTYLWCFSLYYYCTDDTYDKHTSYVFFFLSLGYITFLFTLFRYFPCFFVFSS